MPTSGKHKYLTFMELCSQLQIARSTLDLWRAEGKAPKSFRLPNGKIRFKQEDVDDWIAGL